MKALTLVEPKKFAIIEKDIPVATGNKVVIKVKRTGICGSDIHMIWQTGYNAGYTNRVITHLYSYSANTVTAMNIPLNLSGYSYILLQFENWQTITVWVNVGASINVWTPNNGTTAVSRTITATTSGITISATSNGSSCLYLRNIYGDYMQLPPPEKRVTHHDFRAYIKED